MAEKPKDSRRVAGGTRESMGRERQASAAGTEEPRPKAEGLLEEVLRRENLMKALKRVRSNRGAPGVDGMTVEALTPHYRPKLKVSPQLVKRAKAHIKGIGYPR